MGPVDATTKTPTLVNGDRPVSERDPATDPATVQATDPAVTTGARDKRHGTQPSYGTRGRRDGNKTEPQFKTRDGSKTYEAPPPPSPPRYSQHHQQSPSDVYGGFPLNDFATTTDALGYAWPFAEQPLPWSPSYAMPYPPACGIPYAAAAYPAPYNPFPLQYPYASYVPYQPRAVYWPPQTPYAAPMPSYYGYPVAAYPPVHPDLASPYTPYPTFPPFANAAATVPDPHEQPVHRGGAAHPPSSADVQGGGQTAAGGAPTSSRN